MNNEMFAKFNEMFDAGELQNAIEEASAGKVEKKEVPFGDYEVKVTMLKIDEHKFDDEYKGYPELQVCFTIISDGEYKGQRLYMNKKLVSFKGLKATSFLMFRAKEFLESLESGIPANFENPEQWVATIDSIFKAIDGRAEYQLAFFENNGFKDYAIVKRFQ